MNPIMVKVTTSMGEMVINLALLSWINPKSREFEMSPGSNGIIKMSADSLKDLYARGYLPR